jgi:hypothetical protein
MLKKQDNQRFNKNKIKKKNSKSQKKVERLTLQVC